MKCRPGIFFRISSFYPVFMWGPHLIAVGSGIKSRKYSKYVITWNFRDTLLSRFLGSHISWH